MKAHKLKLEISIACKTALHIGSGNAGQISDSGVITTTTGEPFIPGSSLKGKLRSSAEGLATYLGLDACMLDYSYSGVSCCNCQDWYRSNKDYMDRIRKMDNTKEKLSHIEQVTCDVCQLFGSPLKASRIFISDALCTEWVGVIEVRDGVVIDRDSETTVTNLKFNYDVVPAGTKFCFDIEINDATNQELALIGATLLSWQQGLLLGGLTARGLGRVEIENINVLEVDFTDHKQLIDYLICRQMRKLPDWQVFFQNYIEQCLEGVKLNV